MFPPIGSISYDTRSGGKHVHRFSSPSLYWGCIQQVRAASEAIWGHCLSNWGSKPWMLVEIANQSLSDMHGKSINCSDRVRCNHYQPLVWPPKVDLHIATPIFPWFSYGFSHLCFVHLAICRLRQSSLDGSRLLKPGSFQAMSEACQQCGGSVLHQKLMER